MRSLLASSLVLLVLGVACGVGAASAHAQGWVTPPPPPAATDVVGAEPGLVVACEALPRCACCAPRSRFALSLPVWVPGVTGTLATGTQEAETEGNLVDKLVNDVVTELRFAFVGRVEFLSNRWWGMVDLFGATLGSEIDWRVGTGQTDVELDALIGRVALGYEGWRLPTGGCRGACVTITPYLGLRGYHLDLSINGVGQDRTWVDMIGGVEVRWWLSPRWSLRLLADAGFGPWEEGSEYSWTAGLEVHWRVSRWFSIFAGYNVLAVKYDLDSGNRFLVDLTLAGPQLGFGIDF